MDAFKRGQCVPKASSSCSILGHARGCVLSLGKYINTCKSCAVIVHYNSSMQHISFVGGLQKQCCHSHCNIEMQTRQQHRHDPLQESPHSKTAHQAVRVHSSHNNAQHHTGRLSLSSLNHTHTWGTPAADSDTLAQWQRYPTIRPCS